MMQFQGQHYRRHLWSGWQVKMNGKWMRAVTVFNVHFPSQRSVDFATICWSVKKKSQGIYFSGFVYIIFQLPLIMRAALISGHSLPSASTELSIRLTFVSWCISDRHEEEWLTDNAKFILKPDNISQSKAHFQYFARKKKKKRINAMSSSLF